MTDTLIVGAGPYGLSLAAFLRGRAEFEIAGDPMGAWSASMPEGMHLKSEGFASTLYEPAGLDTLAAFCAAEGIAYADTGIPVSLGTFVAYGKAFQKRHVPNVQERTVTAIRQIAKGFETIFADGGRMRSRRVVMAGGVQHYAQVPPVLGGLPPALLSHSADHHSLAQFAGQSVAVIGGGSSAMDIAAALRRVGAIATIIARRNTVRFQTPLGRRSLRDKIRTPMTSIGPGWKSVLCTRAPLLFHAMPAKFRSTIVRRYLGPAPGWAVRDAVEGHVPIVTGTVVTEATEVDGKARLSLLRQDGYTGVLQVDHVIAATGYRVAVDRVPFLDPALAAAIGTADGAPSLSRNFESSVPGLYFIGPASATSFGPMLRFAAGAKFTATRLSRHLVARTVRQPRRRPVLPHPDAIPAEG
ncbi:NAD(P)-binding domain-containing protein [Acidisphaera sp. L21]|uniref:NAD(P)-binding domain-containing protein n=1 Tax=Acidisphaera sp. L21 TaxID=1641851 RepID=UPI00131BFAD4|nr:NAD(P)-binding domain-containing protein [Acidisphaera sp. L21]